MGNQVTTDNPDYIERTILQLHREYGKDELVATLLKQISELKVESHQLKSEINHLNNELEKAKCRVISERKRMVDISADKEVKKEELYIRLQRKYDEKGKEIQDLKKRNMELFNNIKDLVNKNIMLENQIKKQS